MNEPPYLTERAEALLPDMAGKASSMLEDLVGGPDKVPGRKRMVGADPHARGNMRSFTAKLLGIATTPQIDTNDSAYQEAHAALECGAFSPEETKLMERELPRMRGMAQNIIGAVALTCEPCEVRAALLAKFINARSDEGTMGENLHVGVRRIFERYFKLFDGMQAVANRSGFYKPSDIFLPAFADAHRSAIRKQTPVMPGETIPASLR